MMFSFLNDIGNLEERKVDQWRSDDGARMVSTVQVSDGAQPFETAFKHPEYNKGSMVIVEAYDTRKEAMEGHARWLKIMLRGPLPDQITDCCNAEIGSLAANLGMVVEHPRIIRKAVQNK